jgi:hypothetical protein
MSSKTGGAFHLDDDRHTFAINKQVVQRPPVPAVGGVRHTHLATNKQSPVGLAAGCCRAGYDLWVLGERLVQDCFLGVGSLGHHDQLAVRAQEDRVTIHGPSRS